MVKKKCKVLAISGSIRADSSSELILRYITEAFKSELELEHFELDKLPYFNPDLDNDDSVTPKPVLQFRRSVEKADAILICTPEFVFSIPGVLKNALEWLVSTTLLTYKPAAFIISAASGNAAFVSLNLILSTLLQYPIDDNHKLLINGARSKISKELGITDALVTEQIKKLMKSFVAKIQKDL